MPAGVLEAGAALVAEADAVGLMASVDGRKGDASSSRDEGWVALVAHSTSVTRRELRHRAGVSAADEGPEFDAAKDAELLAWMVQGAYVEVPFSGRRVLSMRWVLTVKPLALPGLHPRPKARLCVRGNEERDKALIVSFSPTISRSTVRLLLILLATMGWEPRTVDVSTAFLQGMPIDRPAPVYVRPPAEAGVWLGFLWLLAKCAYGLVDSPRMWYERVFALMRQLGAVRSPADPGLLVLVQSGAVILVVAFHVDEFLFGGTVAGVALFERELRAAFPAGPVAVCSFVFTDLAVAFSAASAGQPARIRVDQQMYVGSPDDILKSGARRSTPGAAVTSSELTLYRRAAGALLWAVGQTLPHLVCGAAVLARHCRHALVADLVRANKQLAAARASRACCHLLRPSPVGRCLYLLTDSSVVTLRSSSAQTGVAIFLGAAGGVVGAAGSVAAEAEGVSADLVAWGSHRQRRVTHSSFAAEAFGLLQGLRSALDASDVAGLLFDGAVGGGLPVHAFVDSRSLSDSLSSTSATGSQEERACIDDLRDHYRLGSLASVTWLPSPLQLADGLTMPTGASPIRAAVASGWLPLPRSARVTKSASRQFGSRC